MNEITTIVKEFLNKIVPTKYQGVITLILIIGFLSSTATTCIRNAQFDSNEIKKELQKINKRLDEQDGKLSNLEFKLNTVDSTTTQTNYSIILIQSTHEQQLEGIYDIIQQGFSVTNQELVRLHKDDKEYLNIRFEDLSKYISSMIRKDTTKSKINISKLK